MENKFQRKVAVSGRDWEKTKAQHSGYADQNVVFFALAESHEDVFLLLFVCRTTDPFSGVWFLPDTTDLGIRSCHHLTSFLSQRFFLNSPLQPFEGGGVLSHLQRRKLRFREAEELGVRAARVYIAGHAGGLCAETVAPHLSQQSAAGTLLEGNLMDEKSYAKTDKLGFFIIKRHAIKTLTTRTSFVESKTHRPYAGALLNTWGEKGSGGGWFSRMARTQTCSRRGGRQC